jgi:hypothetical protein
MSSFSLIGRKSRFSVLPDRPAKIGAISPIDMGSLLFASDFLFVFVDLALFMPNVHQLQQKCLFCAQMKPVTPPFKRLANVRKRLNSDLFTQNELMLKEP